MSDQTAVSTSADETRSARLAILVLAFGAFAIGTSEFAAMGLLPYFAADLGVTESTAGHAISAYALGVVVGAPITTILGAKLPRRRYLAALIAFFGVMSLLASVLPGFASLTITRFLAGLPHGGYLGVGMLFAADAVKSHKAQASAQVLLGLTVANIIGVPLAGALGQLIGWRWGFALPGVLGLMTAWLILRVAPSQGVAENINPWRELDALKNRAVLWILALGAIGFGGMFAMYAYLTAAILATTDAPGWAIPLTLCMFGIGATGGTIAMGWITEHVGWFRACLLGIILMILAALFLATTIGNWPMMMLAALVMPLGGGLVIPLQMRLSEVAGDAQSMAAAMNHAAFNAANALGPFLAGLALAAGWGWTAPSWVAIGLNLAGLAILMGAYLDMRRGR